MGSFEDWVFKVGGILECAGIEGFLANREQLRETSDDERAEWRAFIEAAVSALPTGRPFTVNTLADAVDTTSSLMDSLPSPLREAWDAKHNFSVRLGQALKKRSGAVFGALRLCRAGREPHSRRPLYRIDAAGSSPTRIRGGGVAGVCGGLASDSRDASDELDWEPEVISTRRALREPPQTPADPCTPPVE